MRLLIGQSCTLPLAVATRHGRKSRKSYITWRRVLYRTNLFTTFSKLGLQQKLRSMATWKKIRKAFHDFFGKTWFLEAMVLHTRWSLRGCTCMEKEFYTLSCIVRPRKHGQRAACEESRSQPWYQERTPWTRCGTCSHVCVCCWGGVVEYRRSRSKTPQSGSTANIFRCCARHHRR